MQGFNPSGVQQVYERNLLLKAVIVDDSGISVEWPLVADHGPILIA
jgi:hypothetical protein